jgi:hypothetical protein
VPISSPQDLTQHLWATAVLTKIIHLIVTIHAPEPAWQAREFQAVAAPKTLGRLPILYYLAL